MVQLKSIAGFVVGGCIGLFLLAVLLCTSFFITNRNRIYPGIMIGPIKVGGLTQEEAEQLVSQSVALYQQRWPVVFRTDGKQVSVSLSREAVTYLVDSSVQRAFSYGRGWFPPQITELMRLPQETIVLPLQTAINTNWLDEMVASTAAQVDTPSIPPRLEMKNGQAEVIPGQTGIELQQNELKQRIKLAIQQLTLPDPVLEMKTVNPTISDQQANQAIERANILFNTELILSLNSDELLSKTWKLSGTDLVGFIQFEDTFNQQKLTDYVSGVAKAVNREPKDAKFQFDESAGKVKEFIAPEKGLVVDVGGTVQKLETALQTLIRSEKIDPIPLVVQEQEPSVTLSEVNRLGLRERLGIGTSTYKGSIPGRVHNVELAATRLNGTLVKPGDTFSFNAAVGEVSAATGYQPAYIIRNGRTELGDGGGLCQDSTTMFRAALDAGLPIVSRKGHAYRVGYYEQDSKPGFDATVFSPSTDLTFLNDTPAHLLIQTSFDSAARKLTFVIYGTHDGRKSTVKDYAIWDVTPPPPDVYQDDPTLSSGVVKQVDWKAVGSKTKFTYVVERQDQIIFEKTFVTNYQPWASVFLRGTRQ